MRGLHHLIVETFPFHIQSSPSLFVCVQQNPANRVEIRCDETLERIMGQKQVTFFSMQGLIKRHRLEKVA